MVLPFKLICLYKAIICLVAKKLMLISIDHCQSWQIHITCSSLRESNDKSLPPAFPPTFPTQGFCGDTHNYVCMLISGVREYRQFFMPETTTRAQQNQLKGKHAEGEEQQRQKQRRKAKKKAKREEQRS